MYTSTMAQTFLFYDLETSGLNPRTDRIMQFAGQRTDMELNPIGEPINVLVKLSDDTLPSPDAVMVTGITPQATQADGLTEAEFAAFLQSDVFKDDTITVGFNNVRFDDEFIRCLFWRTFHNPYEWAWKNGCSRWDMLDVVRMTRALRPEGIEWPIDSEGRATNRLELITKVNGITHQNAHDALSDVEALIDVTRLLKNKQEKLFNYLLSIRDKKSIQKLVSVDNKQPIVYTSGRYDAIFHKTTVVLPITTAPNSNVVVYDLRHDPTPFVTLTEDELKQKLFATWDERKQDGFVPLPVKTMQYNRCPAIAPLGVLEQADGWNRLALTLELIEKHKATLLKHPGFAERLRSVVEKRPSFAVEKDAESRLYDGFLSGPDNLRVETIRNADTRTLADFHPNFDDERLSDLLLRYKARNYPNALSEDEAGAWENWRAQRLQSQLKPFLEALQRLAPKADDSKRFLLEELQLWAEAIMPVPETE
jgi:exodeoxyribonuclease I